MAGESFYNSPAYRFQERSRRQTQEQMRRMQQDRLRRVRAARKARDAEATEVTPDGTFVGAGGARASRPPRRRLRWWLIQTVPGVGILVVALSHEKVEPWLKQLQTWWEARSR